MIANIVNHFMLDLFVLSVHDLTSPTLPMKCEMNDSSKFVESFVALLCSCPQTFEKNRHAMFNGIKTSILEPVL